MEAHAGSFYRTQRESKVLGFFALIFAFLLSVSFMLLLVFDLEGRDTQLAAWFFGLIGVIVFVITVRGAWLFCNPAITWVLSVDDTQVEWGAIGREQRLMLSEIDEMYWLDSDGISCGFLLKDGKRTWIREIELLLRGPQSRQAFVSYMSKTHPEISIQNQRPTRELRMTR